MGWVVGWGCPMGGHQGGQNRQNSGPDGAGGKKWWKFKISIFLVKLCCNLMILAKKPNVNRNFGSKMPNYSCGGCWRFWGLDHSTLKAYIFYTVGRKYFWLVALERTKKDLSEAHKFCPLFFINGPTVISQSTVKIGFFLDAWPIPLFQAVSVKWIDLDKRNWLH